MPLNETLISLVHSSDRNRAGVCYLILIPRAGIASMPDIKSLLQNNNSAASSDFSIDEIVLKAGVSAIDICKDLSVNIEFSEEDEPSPQGKLFKYEIALSVPNDDYATRGKIFRAYDSREFIAVVKERTGAWRVIGSLERGCVFAANLKSGKVKGGVSRYIAALTWEVGGRRAFYTEPAAG